MELVMINFPPDCWRDRQREVGEAHLHGCYLERTSWERTECTDTAS